MSNDIEREIISDIRHSANVDNYTNDQRKFLWSVAERLESLQAERAQPEQPSGVPVAEVVATGGLEKRWANIDVIDADRLKPGDKLYTHHHRLREALKWYGERVKDCNKLGGHGDVARDLLVKDRGELAETILTELDNLENGS